jgi:hypothetical protein
MMAAIAWILLLRIDISSESPTCGTKCAGAKETETCFEDAVVSVHSLTFFPAHRCAEHTSILGLPTHVN